MGGGTGRGAHYCKFCSGSFDSEFMLILHFHEEHLNPQRKKGLLGKESSPGMVILEDDSGSDVEDEDDDDLEVERESEEEDDGDAAMLNFLTDYEKELLRHPIFNPFPAPEEDEFDDDDDDEEEEEVQESEVNFEELLQLEMKDLSERKQLKETEDGAKDPVMVRKSQPSTFSPQKSPSTKSTSSRRKSLSPSKRNQLGVFTAAKQPNRSAGLLPRFRTSEKVTATTDGNQSMGIVTTSRKRPCMLPKAEEGCHHIRSHIKEQPFFCRLCDDSFMSEDHRLAHMKKRHPKPLPFKCRRCDQAYLTRTMLKKHMSHHTAVKLRGARKPFGCKTCGKTYKHLRDLTRHLSRMFAHAAIPISRSLRKLRC